MVSITTRIGGVDHPNGEVVGAYVDETGDRQVEGWHGFIKLKGLIK
jgi:hypothetical protein